jgi:hypothetical protein
MTVEDDLSQRNIAILSKKHRMELMEPEKIGEMVVGCGRNMMPVTHLPWPNLTSSTLIIWYKLSGNSSNPGRVELLIGGMVAVLAGSSPWKKTSNHRR